MHLGTTNAKLLMNDSELSRLVFSGGMFNGTPNTMRSIGTGEGGGPVGPSMCLKQAKDHIRRAAGAIHCLEMYQFLKIISRDNVYHQYPCDMCSEQYILANTCGNCNTFMSYKKRNRN